ncbi:MAG TPA: ABC transporter permease [Cyclobacteriaceae bacterium]|nr:ABC transporter permease [Cyclobacteriaceae bacterium]
MLRNYLRIAVRNLFRHKAFSFINIAGLAIGLSCSILILLWVQFELSFDRFNKDASKLYRITASLPELDVHAAVTPAPLAPAIRTEIPEIKSTVRISGQYSDLLQVDDRMFTESRILYVDSNFFKVFTYSFVEGDPKTALDLPEGILITRDMAKKYFGNEPAIGKTIKKNHKEDFTVTAVLENAPENSHLQFDFIQPMTFLARTHHDLKDNVWDNYNWYSYVLFNDKFQATPASLGNVVSAIERIYKANESLLKVAFELQPVTEIHLHPRPLADFGGSGNSQYVYILIVIAIIVLVVACINFMNLATARSARRAKEVGLRKVSGAGRSQLIRQFLAESSFITLIALILALVAVWAVMPAFNNLAERNLSFNILDKNLLLGLLGICLVTGFLSGSYPALFLSRFMPAEVLKGNIKSGATNSVFRNTLVVVQFGVSIILLIGTAVVYNQLRFIKNQNLGFDKENLIYTTMTGELWNNYKAFRTELEKNSLTSNFAFIEDIPTNLSNATVSVEWEGKDPNSQPLFANLAVDENFFDVFHAKLLAGRGFSKEFTADSANLIVNEKALKIIGLGVDEAIGKPLKLWDRQGTIIGVVKDFNFRPIQQPVEPLLLRLDTWGGNAVVRTRPGETEATIRELERICKNLNPGYPFTYNFLDQDLANMYKSEQRLGRLFNLFSALAIFISCLGLYGLSAFLAERRTKEIGVRKVLGASVMSVVMLLSKNFVRPILVAMAMASPLAWFAMNRWLEGFAFHVDIHWSVFLLAFVTALLIALLTVSYESIKAAMANPSRSLRDE